MKMFFEHCNVSGTNKLDLGFRGLKDHNLLLVTLTIMHITSKIKKGQQLHASAECMFSKPSSLSSECKGRAGMDRSVMTNESLREVYPDNDALGSEIR